MKYTRKIVLIYYPDAKCMLRDFGNEYYQIVSSQGYLGQGKTENEAWRAAYRNITS